LLDIRLYIFTDTLSKYIVHPCHQVGDSVLAPLFIELLELSSSAPLRSLLGSELGLRALAAASFPDAAAAASGLISSSVRTEPVPSLHSALSESNTQPASAMQDDPPSITVAAVASSASSSATEASASLSATAAAAAAVDAIPGTTTGVVALSSASYSSIIRMIDPAAIAHAATHLGSGCFGSASSLTALARGLQLVRLLLEADPFFLSRRPHLALSLRILWLNWAHQSSSSGANEIKLDAHAVCPPALFEEIPRLLTASLVSLCRTLIAAPSSTSSSSFTSSLSSTSPTKMPSAGDKSTPGPTSLAQPSVGSGGGSGDTPARTSGLVAVLFELLAAFSAPVMTDFASLRSFLVEDASRCLPVNEKREVENGAFSSTHQDS